MIEYLSPVLQGLASAVAARLMESQSNQVPTDTIMAEIERLRLDQQRTALEVRQIFVLFEQVVQRVDGLRLTSSAVVFEPAGEVRNLGQALMRLDAEVDAVTLQEQPGPALPAQALPAESHSSIFDDVERDILQLRQRAEGGGQ
ncbi:hypothetical protein ACFFX1_47645 [Dactylosporangium sucinum]|uniref:Uncharacterized protein n=1 Tax=Dactylosporangium sucinum TaxID=1424081 RepID=A0A917TNC2_9ACTN|nr:hypothetical protein [Dactylosporangium sucinum]GGM28989.1 hypothetical protein GCM10007977_032840 [Dactylosporangium sucinum]